MPLWGKDWHINSGQPPLSQEVSPRVAQCMQLQGLMYSRIRFRAMTQWSVYYDRKVAKRDSNKIGY